MKPLAIDLFFSNRPIHSHVVHGKIKGNVNKRRQGSLGEREERKNPARASTAIPRGQLTKTRSHEIPRAQVLAFDDDPLRMVRSRTARLRAISRERGNGLRKVDGILQFSGGHGAEANPNPFARQDRLGWQL